MPFIVKKMKLLRLRSFADQIFKKAISVTEVDISLNRDMVLDIGYHIPGLIFAYRKI